MTFDKRKNNVKLIFDYHYDLTLANVFHKFYDSEL